MKKGLFLTFNFISIVGISQNNYQIGIGAGHGFLQTANMRTGSIGLKFKHDKNIFLDLNKEINDRHKLSLGFRAQMNLYSGWYELDKSIPYYSEKDHIPIFIFESIEINIYVKKVFQIYNLGNTSINVFFSLGPSFNINEGNSLHTRHGIRDNDQNQSFQISYIKEEAQKLFIPYVRIIGGFELMKRVGRKHYLGIGPFISWAGLQSETSELIVLKNDPAYISTGSFKRERSGYGIRLIFSR